MNSKYNKGSSDIWISSEKDRKIESLEKQVQELTLVKTEGYLHFGKEDYGEERTHLPRSRDEKAELERDIVCELKKPNGKSYRQIADELGTSLSMVARVAKQHNLCQKQTK